MRYSIRTEQSYVQWVQRYIFRHDMRHPAAIGAPEGEAFLTHLAVEGNVSASTQNQVRLALLFLYKVVLAPDATRNLLAQLLGVHWLVADAAWSAHWTRRDEKSRRWRYGAKRD